jgi:hypothetical protein
MAGQHNGGFRFIREGTAKPLIMPLELIGKRVMGYTMHLEEIMLIPTG